MGQTPSLTYETHNTAEKTEDRGGIPSTRVVMVGMQVGPLSRPKGWGGLTEETRFKQRFEGAQGPARQM